MKLHFALVVPVLLNESECWCPRKEDERRLLVAGVEEKKSEMKNTREELGLMKQWQKRSRKGDMGNGWRKKNYQSRLHMDT